MNTPISIYRSQFLQFLQILGISASVITAPLQRVVFDYVLNHRPEHSKKHYGRNNQQCRYTQISPRIAPHFIYAPDRACRCIHAEKARSRASRDIVWLKEPILNFA
jgi:hypothetical protein